MTSPYMKQIRNVLANENKHGMPTLTFDQIEEVIQHALDLEAAGSHIIDGWENLAITEGGIEFADGISKLRLLLNAGAAKRPLIGNEMSVWLNQNRHRISEDAVDMLMDFAKRANLRDQLLQEITRLLDRLPLSMIDDWSYKPDLLRALGKADGLG